MTSTLTTGPQQQRLEGRTVRDIAEYDPAQVNEVWCRKIFRQILQSLELQYAMHMPHRAITPDTVVFHDNGEPLLLATDIPVPESEQHEAADLTALARVVHFAITRELAPEGPLHGRVLEGYSESLLSAVDRCMDSDPARRPRSIEELRQILGIVSLGAGLPARAAGGLFIAPPPGIDIDTAPAPAAAPDSLPSFLRETTPAAKPGAGLSRWQRRALAAGAAAALLAIGLAVFAELRDSGSYDHIVLTLPQSGEQAHAPAAATAPAASAAPAPALPAAQPPEQVPDNAGSPADQAANQAAAGEAAAPPVSATEHPAQAAPAAAAPLPAVRGSATYRLKIRPWGVVYVDGIDRGVSPPVKRLVLAPGRHTVRISNPNFQDRVLEVDSKGGNAQISADFYDEPRQVRTNP
jgi:hypothetical protein